MGAEDMEIAFLGLKWEPTKCILYELTLDRKLRRLASVLLKLLNRSEFQMGFEPTTVHDPRGWWVQIPSRTRIFPSLTFPHVFTFDIM